MRLDGVSELSDWWNPATWFSSVPAQYTLAPASLSALEFAYGQINILKRQFDTVKSQGKLIPDEKQIQDYFKQADQLHSAATAANIQTTVSQITNIVDIVAPILGQAALQKPGSVPPDGSSSPSSIVSSISSSFGQTAGSNWQMIGIGVLVLGLGYWLYKRRY